VEDQIELTPSEEEHLDAVAEHIAEYIKEMRKGYATERTDDYYAALYLYNAILQRIVPLK
jgi:cell division protein ZapA (FtsZ GTPase activity inhibitor)